MATQYYVDGSGNYMGGFDGAHGVDLSAYTEVANPPASASDIWNGTTYVGAIATLKAKRYGAIDIKTMALIGAGFSYDSEQFSLSIYAQSNWNGLHSNQAAFIWPYEVTTLDNNIYSLAEANLPAFWTAGKVAIETHMASGRALKKSIFDAVDIAAVDAVEDTR